MKYPQQTKVGTLNRVPKCFLCRAQNPPYTIKDQHSYIWLCGRCRHLVLHLIEKVDKEVGL